MGMFFAFYTYVLAPVCTLMTMSALISVIFHKYMDKQKRKALPDSSLTTLELSGGSSVGEDVGKINQKLRQLRNEKIAQLKTENETLFQKRKIDLEKFLDEDILPQMYERAENPISKPEFIIDVAKMMNGSSVSIPDRVPIPECDNLLDALGELLKERGIVAIRREASTHDIGGQVFVVKW